MLELEKTARIEEREIAEESAPKVVPDGVAFDYQVIDDELMKDLFHTVLWLQELYPLYSRVNFLSNCSEREAELFRMMVDRAITRLKYTRKSRQEKMLLNNLKSHFNMRINDSVHGWKVNTLATQRKELTLTQIREKKGRFRR